MGTLCVVDALRIDTQSEMERAMTANSNRGSAKIYQFPAGGRAGLAGRNDAARPVAEFAPSRVAKVASGSAWYHEEAVQDAERTPKN
jgi:uncharacterized protein DUF2735